MCRDVFLGRHVYLSAVPAGALGSLELQAVLSCPMKVLGTELRTSSRAVSILNCYIQ